MSLKMMSTTQGTFSQHQTITKNLHLFFSWKTHRWHPCTLVPDSVQQGMTGASESCGKGLEMRGKRSLFHVKEWILMVQYKATCCCSAFELYASLCTYMNVFIALSSALFIGTVQVEVKAVKHHRQCKRNCLPLGHRWFKKKKKKTYPNFLICSVNVWCW